MQTRMTTDADSIAAQATNADSDAGSDADADSNAAQAGTDSDWPPLESMQRRCLWRARKCVGQLDLPTALTTAVCAYAGMEEPPSLRPSPPPDTQCHPSLGPPPQFSAYEQELDNRVSDARETKRKLMMQGFDKRQADIEDLQQLLIDLGWTQSLVRRKARRHSFYAISLTCAGVPLSTGASSVANTTKHFTVC